jgi:hypothetical protein
MKSKTKRNPKLMGDVVAVRLGPIRDAMDKLCARMNDGDRSEFIRDAIERAVRANYFEREAACAGAARAFTRVLDAAYRAGLVNVDVSREIESKVHEFEALMRDKLEKDFADRHPDAIAFEQKQEKLARNGQRDLLSSREHPDRERWNAEILAHFDFPDMGRVAQFVWYGRHRKGDGDDVGVKVISSKVSGPRA